MPGAKTKSPMPTPPTTKLVNGARRTVTAVDPAGGKINVETVPVTEQMNSGLNSKRSKSTVVAGTQPGSVENISGKDPSDMQTMNVQD